MPINFTFYKIGNNIIVDPTTVEEGAIDAKFSVALSNYGNQIMINGVQKGEIKEFTIEEMNKTIDLAEETFKKYSKKIFSMIK